MNADGKYVYTDSAGRVQKAHNGVYVEKNGDIYLDLNAGNHSEGLVLNTFAHELYHHVEKQAPEQAKALAEFIAKELGEENVEAAVNRQIEKARNDNHGEKFFMKEMGMSAEEARQAVRDRAYSDFIADGLETMFTKGDVVHKLADLHKQDKGLSHTIRKFIRKWVSKLREFYNAGNTLSIEGRLVAELETFDEIQQMFAEALKVAGENFQAQKNTAGGGGADLFSGRETEAGAKFSTKGYSAQADITKRYQSTVDQILNMTNTNKDHIIIGYTPEIYSTLGMPSLPFVIGTGHIYSAAKTEAEAKLDGNYHRGVHYHGLGANVIKNIYDALKDPVLIISSKDVSKNAKPMRSTHSVVAIVDIGSSSKSLLLPIEITAERTVGGARMDVNALSSIYDKTVSNLVSEAIAMENAGEVGVFYAKKEALTLPGAGVQFPVRLQQSIASNGIIHRFSEKVNMNVADATQSQQFKRWFGDWQNHPHNASKVVNADGTPKVMYHGSPAQFTVFDKKKAKSSGLYGRGFYFTDSDTHAGTYGNLYSVYLNIRNPLQHGNAKVTRDQVRTYLEAIAENEDYSIENYGTYDVDKILQTVMGSAVRKDAFQVIQDISATAIGDMVEAAELFNSVNGTDFDGIIVPTETVAFRPEQIKSATDNIGTFDGTNPDIRYSARDTESVSNRSLLANALDSVAQDESEKRRLAEYREAIGKLEGYEKHLAELKEQIRELSFGKGPRDMAKIRALKDEAIKTANRIGIYDKKLLRLESTKTLERLLNREMDKVRYQERRRAETSRKRNVDSRNKTQVRHEIQKTAGELKKLFARGKDARNVKQEMRDMVAKSMELAEKLFGPGTSDINRVSTRYQRLDNPE